MQVLAKQKQSGKEHKNNSSASNQKTNDSDNRRIMTFGYATPGTRKKNLNRSTGIQETQKPYLHDLSKIPLFSQQTKGIQPKLEINQPNDKYEQEADQMANQVMRMTENKLIQRKCKKCEDDEKLQMKPLASQVTHLIQRHTLRRSENIKEMTQEKADGSVLFITPTFLNRLKEAQNGGSPLPSQTNRFMSRSFGANFSHVRIHNDGISHQMSRNIQAKAFTYGSNIFFNSGEYNPVSYGGKKLIAHELAHTIQQGKSTKNIWRKQSSKQQTISRKGSSMTEEELERAQKLSQTGQPLIQRSVSWARGTIHQTVNLADMSFGGAAPITWEMLNGTMLKSHAIATGAIKSPTISTSNSGGIWKAKVTSVPRNTGSFDETVLSRGPWTKVVTKAQAGAVTGQAACAGAGNSTFRAKGKPSDNAVFRANRRHENHHASDHKLAFNAIIKVWDSKVTRAKNRATEFNGASDAAATSNLWAAMGGTPANRAIAFNDSCGTRGTAFHATPKGGPMTTSNPGSDITCANSWEEVRNPS